MLQDISVQIKIKFTQYEGQSRPHDLIISRLGLHVHCTIPRNQSAILHFIMPYNSGSQLPTICLHGGPQAWPNIYLDFKIECKHKCFENYSIFRFHHYRKQLRGRIETNNMPM